MTEKLARQLAEKLGVTVRIIDGSRYCHFAVGITTPPGHKFAGTLHSHELICEAWYHDTKEDVWESILTDLKLGIAPCTDPDCKNCCPKS